MRIKNGIIAGGVASMMALARTLSSGARLTAAVPEGWTVLRITEGEIEVNGKKGMAYSIQHDDGTHGYTGIKGQQFRSC